MMQRVLTVAVALSWLAQPAQAQRAPDGASGAASGARNPQVTLPVRLGPPPRAKEVTGPIDQIELGPIFGQAFVCSEHPFGQLAFAGDALGTDCMIEAADQEAGFSKLYRTDGRANADWFGWHAVVLSPLSGIVLGTLDNPIENRPGAPGRPPASTIRIRRTDGVIVVLAHVTAISVAAGDVVTAGQPIARVGNNGVARAPHIHLGAWRESDKLPLQIRWDLKAVATAQAAR